MNLLTLPPLPDAPCDHTHPVTRRQSLPLAHPARQAAHPARVRVTFRPGHPDAGLSLADPIPADLRQLQDRWDTEAAHLNVRRFRLITSPAAPAIDAPTELPWLAALLVLAPLALLALAVVTP